MRQLFIPTIGDSVTLAADWTFTVHNEHRNQSLIEWMGQLKKDFAYGQPLGEVKRPDGGRDWEATKALSVSCTLPKGTVLRVDRIYIRKNLKEFDSVTFFLKGAKTKQERHQRTTIRITPNENISPREEALGRRVEYDRVKVPYTQIKPARPVRFWAKLADVNRMKIK